MIDFHLATFFHALCSEHNYLRIQDDTLGGTVSSVDVATKENLESLLKVGEELLKKQVARVNPDTGISEPAYEATNREALVKLAKILSKEKRLREARTPKGKIVGQVTNDLDQTYNNSINEEN